jgi:hypothetical protein
LIISAGRTKKNQAYWIGPAAEMAHVGVERLGAGHRQHHRAHRDEGEESLLEEELDGPIGLSEPTISDAGRC